MKTFKERGKNVFIRNSENINKISSGYKLVVNTKKVSIVQKNQNLILIQNFQNVEVI